VTSLPPEIIALGAKRIELNVKNSETRSSKELLKSVLMQLGRDIGFDPVDAGPLKIARYLEPMGMLMINLGYPLGMGPKIGIKLVKD
jgi:hypothetical protein